MTLASFHQFLRAFGVLWLVLVAPGCERNSRVEPSERATPGAPEKRAQTVIRFSDPGNAGVVAYVKRHGLLDAPLAANDARVEWVPAAGAFSANFEAMNAGAINASGGAVSPIIGALAHNLKFRIYAIGDPGDIKQSGLIVPKGSPVTRVEELAGKRVAVNWAAHGDYILLRALEKHGVPADRVTRVPIQPPDAAAAFATGKLDGWATFGVFYTTAIQNGARVIANEAEIDSEDVTVLAASERILSENPRAFQALLRVIQAATRTAHTSPEKFQNVFDSRGPRALSGELLKVAIDEVKSAPIHRVPTTFDRERIARVTKLLFDNRSIDRSIAVDDIVFDIDRAAAAQKGGS
jgi:sulfonate transport system substrate-binding protein